VLRFLIEGSVKAPVLELLGPTINTTQLARCNLRTVDRCFFDRYVGIDCSGAKTPTSSLPGLRVYVANRNSFPSEVQPPSSPRKYWTRRGIAEWLVEHLSEARPTLVGIDHGFSFPVRFFDEYRLPHEWPAFLDDFQKHWPTDQDIYVAFGVTESAEMQPRDGATRVGGA
jgi:hypothetical protein